MESICVSKDFFYILIRAIDEEARIRKVVIPVSQNELACSLKFCVYNISKQAVTNTNQNFNAAKKKSIKIKIK